MSKLDDAINGQYLTQDFYVSEFKQQIKDLFLELMLKQYEETLKDGYGLKQFNVELRQKVVEL